MKTRYGGGFVQSIDGLGGARPPAGTVDWFYYVNGVEAPDGRGGAHAPRRRPRLVGPPRLGRDAARARRSSARSRSRSCTASSGKRLPVRVECAAARAARLRRRVQRRLARRGCPAGARRRSAARARAGDAARLVGPWRALARRPALASSSSGPAGQRRVRALRADGRTLALLDADGQPSRGRAPPGTGLVAATRCARGRAPVWVVTGTDAAGVDARRARARRGHAAQRFARRGRRRAASACRCASGGAVARAVYRRRASPLHAARAGGGARVLRRARRSCALLVRASRRARRRARGRARRAARRRRGARRLARARAAGARRSRCVDRVVNALVTRDGLTVFARLGDVPAARPARPHARGARLRRGRSALRVWSLVLRLRAVRARPSTPTSCCALLRRVSFRSALTAALATRLVPVLARDARRWPRRARCRAAAAPARARSRARAVATGALDRALDVAATLEVRGYGAARRARRAARAAVVAPRPRVRRLGGRARRAGVVGRASRASARFDAYPQLTLPRRRRRPSRCALALLAPSRCAPFADRRGIAR